ncbi:MAG: hypothetical protein QOG60_862, partial [Frankiaceae bacterium]|nr:hypothetical protein [Frankiaceae bacterium]
MHRSRRAQYLGVFAQVFLANT